MVLVSLLLSCLVAIAFSSRLRELIAGPILELAEIARSVSHSNDYSIRATKHSQDELGTLADALNQMMKGIQSRDNELQMALADQRDALDRLAQLNSDLKHSNTELGRSNNDLERFAFMASHDLQEPLRMITLYSELLIGESLTNDEGRRSEFVKHIVGGTRRMRELLADLLAYNELAGIIEQPVESVDLNVVLRKAQQTLNVGIDETQAEIIVEQLPTLYAHPSRMASLFENLIGNAIKYRSQRPLRICISLKEDNNQFTFAVSDNGIGIEREYQEKIFLAFQRLHGKDIPGTGIGLAICQRVVERYSGRIWVESEFGAGSTFRFTLPKSMAPKVI
jgi:light-regulated signal transduction histidine kinase (bacteriophytochrome)